MIYLRYDFRWKNYKSLGNLSKERKSEFEMKYAPSDIRAMNERFYSDFQKRGTYITCVTDVTDCEIVIYAAVDIQSLDALLYEKEVSALFHDCDMIKKTEVTIEEYKREISRDVDFLIRFRLSWTRRCSIIKACQRRRVKSARRKYSRQRASMRRLSGFTRRKTRRFIWGIPSII